VRARDAPHARGVARLGDVPEERRRACGISLGAIMRTTQQQARVAGFYYLLLALTAPVGLVYVPGKLFVDGNAAATAENLRTSAGLLRVGIACDLAHQVVCIFLVLALYRLFQPVDEWLAKQVVILGALVSVPIMFVNVLNEVAALALASPADYLTVFDRPQRDALAYLFVELHGAGISVVSVFWSLWLFPFGLLAIRSGFIPRVFGVLLILAGVAYLATSFTELVLPRYEHLVSQLASPLKMGELPMVVWLVGWGARKVP
jgi:hypothetical protein